MGLGATAFAQTDILHVDPVATGMNDGTTWLNAYTDLQAALLQAASSLASPGGPQDVQVWVRAARSPYIPTLQYDGSPSTQNPRTRSFGIPQGVKLYGGFRGDETLLDQRAGLFRNCILSGDIGAPNDRSDNCFTVGRVYTQVGSVDPNQATIVDGFVVTGGNADGSGGPTIPNPLTSGGGFFVQAAATRIDNVTFLSNTAIEYGGGLYFEGSGEGAARGIQPYRSFFHDNVAGNGGGAALNSIGRFFDPLFVDDSYIYNCSFTGNRAKVIAGGSGQGGGLWVGTRDGFLTVCNSIINENRSQGEGSGIYLGGIPASQVIAGVRIGNCTITANSWEPVGASNTNTGCVHYGVLPTGPQEELTNCIVWGNTAGTPFAPQVGPTTVLPMVKVEYCCVEQAIAGAGNFNADPLFSSAFDLRLGPGSPCKDMGSDSLLLNDLPDMDSDGITNTFPLIEVAPYDWTGSNARQIDVVTTQPTPNVVDVGALEAIN